MRWMSCVIVTGLVVGLVGCGGERGEVKGKDGKELVLVTPGPTTLKQGEAQKVIFKVTRKNIEDEVKVEFSDLPEGVRFEESNHNIPKGSTEGSFILHATPKATPVEGHRAKATASAGSLKVGPLEFTINVKPMK